jgi:predicted ATPase
VGFHQAQTTKFKLKFSVPDLEYEKIMQEQGTVKTQLTTCSSKGGGGRSLWVDSILNYLTFDMARDCRQMKKHWAAQNSSLVQERGDA